MAVEEVSKRSNLFIHDVDRLRPPQDQAAAQGVEARKTAVAANTDTLQKSKNKDHFWKRKKDDAVPLSQGAAPAQRGLGWFCCGLCAGAALSNSRVWANKKPPTQTFANVPPPPVTKPSAPADGVRVVYED